MDAHDESKTGAIQSASTSPAHRTCAADDVLQRELARDPSLAKRMAEIDRHAKDYELMSHSALVGTAIIPVVVHVVYGTEAENISDAQVQSQIDVLNEDFRRTNSDADGTWPEAADSNIELCLTGISRTASTVASHGTDNSIKFTSQGGRDVYQPDKYLNVWIGDIGGGILGYAQFPGGNPATDGIVLDYRYTGRGGTAIAPFDLGRTATHEVGHYLNLRHIWGDGGCSVDDSVGDTPESDGPNFSCAPSHQSCGTTDMVQNYMDYSDDACMNLFTEGQAARMRALFDEGGARSSMDIGGGAACEPVDFSAPPPPPPPPPACDDNELALALALDNYPDETTWEVHDSNGVVLDSGGPYAVPGETAVEPLCLSDGCYDLTIYDAYSDGMCCEYGNGSYELTDADGNVLAAGAEFAASETTRFCVGNVPPPPPPPPCEDNEVHLALTLDDYPGETTWDIQDDSGATPESGGPYETPGATVAETACLADGCYDFTIYDSFGDGLCCNYGNGSYELTDADGTMLASGAEFELSETTSFCVGDGSGHIWTRIDDASTDFESGWGGYRDGGRDCRRTPRGWPYAHQGDYAALIRDNSRRHSSFYSAQDLALGGYSELKIEFWYMPRSMEPGEDFFVEISTDGGATYQTVAAFVSGVDFMNGTFENPTVNVSGVALNDNVRLRFRCDASGNRDVIFIDEIEVSAR